MEPRIIDVVDWPFAKGDLTSDGIQYSDLHTTTTDEYEEVEKNVDSVPTYYG
jgi:hypothetical protein